jgi:transposase
VPFLWVLAGCLEVAMPEAYKTFAEMIERHWEGIVVYCHPQNRCTGFVEGLNNKIRVIQRRVRTA